MDYVGPNFRSTYPLSYLHFIPKMAAWGTAMHEETIFTSLGKFLGDCKGGGHQIQTMMMVMMMTTILSVVLLIYYIVFY